MGENLAENLRTYTLQLNQVEAALIAEPDNNELLKLQSDLKEVIELTTELIRNQVEPEASGSAEGDDDGFPLDDSNEAEDGERRPPSIQWKSGDMCLAPWSKDKTGRLFRAVIEEVNEGGLCTIMFPKWGTPDVTLVSKLRPLPEHLKAKMDGGDDEDDEESQAAKATTAQKKEELLKHREYLKKKKQKKLDKLKEIDKSRETDKNKWLAFKNKAVHKNKKGVTKASIFASPENVDGRVGVGTCGVSGKGMTNFKGAKKYQRNV